MQHHDGGAISIPAARADVNLTNAHRQLPRLLELIDAEEEAATEAATAADLRRRAGGGGAETDAEIARVSL